MSAISTSASGLSGATGPGVPDKISAMSSGDFLRVMFAELTRQDPLQPNETKDLLQQVATIRSIESNIGLSDNLKQLVKQNEAASAGNLVGQTVKGLDQAGAPVTGVVRSVRITRDGSSLNLLDGRSIAVKDLQEILGFMLEDPSALPGDQGGVNP